MKRFILSFALAVGIHAVLLGTAFKPFAVRPRLAFTPRPLTLTLVAHQPLRPPQPAVPEKKKEIRSAVSAPSPPKPEKKVAAKAPVRPRKSTAALKPQVKKRKKPLPVPDRSAPASVSANPSPPRPASVPPPETPVEAQTEQARLPEPRTTTGGQLHPPGAPVPAASVIREASPLYRVNPPPHYPLSARRRGYQGTVILEVFVGSTGRVIDLRLTQSSGHAALDNAALKAVKRWNFTPGSRDDQPVDMWVRVPVRFQLR